ncbi:MAG: hypothetical protein N4A39_16915 [Roseicyclus sp.]|jgi:hypothetical protein|nr:hypothetical protein [Roseicyclus sp.]
MPASANHPLPDLPPGSPGRPPRPRYKQQFGVIVIARDEDHQRRVYERLVKQGLTCKVVNT